MDINKLIRSPEKIHACLTELPSGQLVTSKKLCIYIPTRFAERNMAYVGLDNYILGIYAIVLDDTFYGTSLVNAMINIDPTETNRIKINDEQYFEFTFKPGSTVFKNVNLVKTDVLCYSIYDEFFSNGRIPWYVSYEDLGKIFDTAYYHAGANIGTSKEVTELIASIVARDKDDRNKFFRTTVNTLADLDTKRPVIIGLHNVSYSATNTTNRLGGSYMSIGVTAALVSPTSRVEKIENLLRA